MTDPINPATPSTGGPPGARPAERGISRSKAALAGAGLLGLGLFAGGGTMLAMARADTVQLATPTAISALSDSGTVAIKGRVAEVFGNKFVLADATGRALVETGKRGEDTTLVAPQEEVTVQGRFDRGFLKGEVIVRADGTAQSLKPFKPGPRGWAERLHGGTIDLARVPDAG